jgi:hypothetical protein
MTAVIRLKNRINPLNYYTSFKKKLHLASLFALILDVFESLLLVIL